MNMWVRTAGYWSVYSEEEKYLNILKLAVEIMVGSKIAIIGACPLQETESKTQNPIWFLNNLDVNTANKWTPERIHFNIWYSPGLPTL